MFTTRFEETMISDLAPILPSSGGRHLRHWLTRTNRMKEKWLKLKCHFSRTDLFAASERPLRFLGGDDRRDFPPSFPLAFHELFR